MSVLQFKVVECSGVVGRSSLSSSSEKKPFRSGRRRNTTFACLRQQASNICSEGKDEARFGGEKSSSGRRRRQRQIVTICRSSSSSASPCAAVSASPVIHQYRYFGNFAGNPSTSSSFRRTTKMFASSTESGLEGTVTDVDNAPTQTTSSSPTTSPTSTAPQTTSPAPVKKKTDSLEAMRKFSEQYAKRSNTFFCIDKVRRTEVSFFFLDLDLITKLN